MKKRILSVILCLALSLGLVTPATLAAQQPVSPAPVIVVTPIRGGETLEISIQTTDAAKAVHAVLSYDSSLLTPIQWDSGKTVINIPEGNGWESSAAVHTLGYGGASGKPGLTYKTAGNNTAYLYLGAESMAEPMPGSTVVVTARFRYSDGMSEAQKALAASAVAFAVEAVAASSPANYVEAVIGADGKYYIAATAAPSAEYALLTKGEVQVQPEGPSQLPDGGTITGGYAITFFDWDGSAIDAISGEGDMSAAVAALTGTSATLTKKAGYDFDTWLTVTSDSEGLHTAHGTLTSSKSGVTEGNQDIADFSNVQSNLLVQAAYKTNTRVNSGQGADGSLTEDTARYVIGAPTFYQYGISPDATNGQYAVRCTVNRSSVLRADKPTVLAMVYVGSGSNMKAVTVKVDLDSTDSASFEVVVPKATTNITFTVLDTYGITAWTMGTSRSKEGSAANSEIVKGGSFALLVDEAWAVAQGGGWTSYINVQCFQDAGYSKVSTSNLDAAKTAIADASKAVGGKLDRAAADAALAAYR